MAAARFYNPDKTRFENTEELKTVADIMRRMYQKETDLNRAAAMKNDNNSLDHKKAMIVTSLVEGIDKIIADFNKVPEPKDDIPRLQQIIMFADYIHKLTDEILQQHAVTLKEPRDTKMQTARTASYYGVLGAATAVALFQTFATGAAILLASHHGGERAKKAAGFNDPNAQSYRWIQELNDIVEAISKNLAARIATINVPAASPPQVR
jgi:hypothetical protein